MKIRRDFVTNSSSSNFVTAAVDMVPTVIVTYGTVSAILSRYDATDDDLPEYIVQIDADNLVFGSLEDTGRVDIQIHRVTSSGSTQTASGAIKLSSNCPNLMFEPFGNGHHVTELKFNQVPTIEEIVLEMEIHTPAQVEKEKVYLQFAASLTMKTDGAKTSINCDEEDSITLQAFFNGGEYDESVLERANKSIEIGIHPDTDLGKDSLYFTNMETNETGFWGEIKASAIKNLPKDKDIVPVTLVASGELNGELYSEEFVVQLNAMLELKLSKEYVTVLVDSPDPYILNAKMEGHVEEWEFELIQEDQVLVSTEIERIEPNEVNLLLRAEVVAFGEKDMEIHGEFVVRSKLGELELETPIEVVVVREGVLLEDALEGERFKVLTGADEDSFKEANLHLAVAYYDREAQKLDYDLKYDALKVLEITSEDEDVEKLHKVMPVSMICKSKYDGYHTAGFYTFESELTWIHKNKETLTGTIVVGLEEDPELYRLEIPATFTAQLEKPKKDWNFEVDACRKIITKYLPPELKNKRLPEFEEMKEKMGAEEIYALRHEIWQQVLVIMEKEVADFESEANWYDWGMYAADWVKWICDQAFAAAANAVLSPVGGFALVNFKEITIEYFIDLYFTNKSAQDFTYEFVAKKCFMIADKSGEEIIKYFAKEHPNDWKYIAGFFLYKVSTHYALDNDEAGKPKGMFEAIRAATLDLAGVAFGDYAEEFEIMTDGRKLGNGIEALKQMDIFKDFE